MRLERGVGKGLELKIIRSPSSQMATRLERGAGGVGTKKALFRELVDFFLNGCYCTSALIPGYMKSKNLKILAQYVSRIRDEKEAKDFLQGLFTVDEVDEMARRIQIVEQLKMGLPQRKISEGLGVGIATVTRGMREIKLKRFNTLVWRDFEQWRHLR